jgi:hypothetical protein
VKLGLVTFNSEVRVIGDGGNIQQAEDYDDGDYDNLFKKLTKNEGSF